MVRPVVGEVVARAGLRTRRDGAAGFGGEGREVVKSCSRSSGSGFILVFVRGEDVAAVDVVVRLRLRVDVPPLRRGGEGDGALMASSMSELKDRSDSDEESSLSSSSLTVVEGVVE